jgi:tRNA(Ile)-lysidine synthase
MTDFFDRLETSFRTLGLEETSVLLAISGGADSVALLHGAVALRETLKLKLVAAHLNHTLRGTESDGDECFVKELCERLQVPVQIGSENIAALASAAGAGVEETARRVRYDFLKRVAADANAAAVATAHSADDQAETVLHHLIRGTGLAGMRGISPARAMSDSVRLVRPLLFATRAEIEAYLAELQQPYRTDSTNADESQTRSRIRRSLLPLLERDYNPQVREALVRVSDQARDAQESLELLAKRFVEQAIEQRDATTCRLNADILADLPRHLLRECFLSIWKQMNWPRQPMGFTEWERLADLSATGGAIQLPGNIDARTRGRLIVLSRG